MEYYLPDGNTIDIQEINDIGIIKELGRAKNHIEKRILGFNITFKNGQSIIVQDVYHYNDWFQVKKRLHEIREEIKAKKASLDTQVSQ